MAMRSWPIATTGPGKHRRSRPLLPITASVVGEISKDSKQKCSEDFRTISPAFWLRMCNARISKSMQKIFQHLLRHQNMLNSYLHSSFLSALFATFRPLVLQRDPVARACCRPSWCSRSIPDARAPERKLEKILMPLGPVLSEQHSSYRCCHLSAAIWGQENMVYYVI